MKTGCADDDSGDDVEVVIVLDGEVLHPAVVVGGDAAAVGGGVGAVRVFRGLQVLALAEGGGLDPLVLNGVPEEVTACGVDDLGVPAGPDREDVQGPKPPRGRPDSPPTAPASALLVTAPPIRPIYLDRERITAIRDRPIALSLSLRERRSTASTPFASDKASLTCASASSSKIRGLLEL